MTYYIDIDGTMTDSPKKRWGTPQFEVINKVKQLIEDKHIVIVWSSGGWGYARRFCAEYNLNPTYILPKPDVIVDDIFTIRDVGRISYLTGENLNKEI